MMAIAQPTSLTDSYARDCVLEYLLVGDLRDLLEEKPDSETRHWLLAVLEELLDLLPNEFEFEDEGGYLAEVCEQVPNWSPEVERLHREQHELYCRLLELRNRIVQEESFAYIAGEVKPQLQRWIEGVQRHRDQEQRLLVAAYDLTFGGEA